MEYTFHLLVHIHILEDVGVVAWGKDCVGRCGKENRGKTVGIEDHSVLEEMNKTNEDTAMRLLLV